VQSDLGLETASLPISKSHFSITRRYTSAHDRKSDPESAGRGGARGFGTKEWLAKPCQGLLWHARTSIAHGNAHA
jgi:hypothetical protein